MLKPQAEAMTATPAKVINKETITMKTAITHRQGTMTVRISKRTAAIHRRGTTTVQIMTMTAVTHRGDTMTIQIMR